MADTTKPMSEKDFQQVLRGSFNDSDKTLSTNGFVSGKVGHKITRTAVSSTIDDFRYLDVVYTKTGTLTSAQPTVTGLSRTNELTVGQYIFHANVPANTTILTIDSPTQITMSANATGSGSASLQFANLLYTIRIEYSNAAHDDINVAERIA